MSASAALRLDPPPAAPLPAGPAVVLPFPQPKAYELSATERQVIWLSRSDPAPRGRTVSTLLRILGARTAGQPLGDPKLEALRRFAVVLRTTRGCPSHAEVRQFRAAGYDEALLFPVFELVTDGGRPSERSARFWRLMVTLAVFFGFLPPVAIALTDYFEDPRLGVMGTAMIFVTAAPLVANLLGSRSSR